MVRGKLLSDDLLLPDISLQQPTHPMDSSRVLLGLMALSRKAADVGDHDALEGVISSGVLRSLLSALHFRDVTTVRHARRVALLAVGMAQYLGWEARHLKILEVSALLHDIGKIGVPDNILFKPSTLSPDEAELMALHHNIGIDVLQACRVDGQVLEIVDQSHSYYNGATDGFRRIGSDVNLGARILAVADAYDSLATDQVYRKAKPHEEIMQILMQNAGTQFDGNVVCALARWTQEAGPRFKGQTGGDFGNPVSISGPAHPEETLEASSLGHIFSYLYVLESLYDGFYLVNSDLRFVVWNSGAEKLLGFPTQQMLKRVWTSRELEYADRNGHPHADHECPMHQVLATGRPVTSTVQMRHADGNWKDVEVQTVPLVDHNLQLQGVAEIFRDLSRSSRKPQEYRALRIAASRDPLTSVANRGELETQLMSLLTTFAEKRYQEPFSIIFLDVDFFKTVNDRFGHTVGDTVLIEVARALQHETYSGELVGRYGGEEFIVLCPATELDSAIKRAERLRIAMAQIQIAELGAFQLTASFGVTQVEAGDNVESILRRVDKALYMAKEDGRNQTRSLTNAQLLAGLQPDPSPPPGANTLAFQGSFYAFVAADMIVYKLGGFVNDQDAKLIEVAPKRASFRLGHRGLLPFWGTTDDRRPVEVELSFGDVEPLPRNTKNTANRVQVAVKIRPIGWIKDAEVFQTRAKRILKELRSYFVGDAE